MVATDDELLVINMLDSGWNVGAVAKPKFYYDDSIKIHDYRTTTAAVKVYMLNKPEEARGLGYTSRKFNTFVSIDMRSQNRDNMNKVRDEVLDILQTNRKGITGYDVIFPGTERKIAAYLNFFHYVRDITLRRYAQPITV